MINRIHYVISAHVLSSVSPDDVSTAQELLDLCYTFSSVSMNVYKECLSIMIDKLKLDKYNLYKALTTAKVDNNFITQITF